MPHEPKTETWYTWKEFKVVEGETEPRLLTPWANHYKYEFDFGFLFETKDQAWEQHKQLGGDPGWYLCKITLEPTDEVSPYYEEGEV